MSNVIFVMYVSSLPDPLSSWFVGFKYFMQEEFFCCPNEEFFLACACRNFTLSGPPAPVKVCSLESFAIYTAWQHPCALPTSFVHFPPVLQVPLSFRTCSNFGNSQSTVVLFLGCDFCDLFDQTSGRTYSGLEGANVQCISLQTRNIP